jgi:uncharacterized coiled-coil DUF342 family protein
MSKTKRALCIGINYLTSPESRLYGCIRDAIEMSEFLQDSLGYKRDDIVVLRDDMSDAMPTASRIISELNRIQANSFNLDEIIIHYSGHGAQLRDSTGDEKDNYDECIIPSDFKTSGVISDDMLGMIVSGMRCRTIIIMDCCHSATCIDLPYLFYVNPTNNAIEKQVIQSRVGYPANVIMISGCKDSQTSADAYFKENSSSMGVLTNSILNVHRSLSQKSDYAMRYIPLSTFFTEVSQYIRKNGFAQEVCLSTSMNTEVESLNQMSFFYNPPSVVVVSQSTSDTSSYSSQYPSYIMGMSGEKIDACGNRPPYPNPSYYANVTIPVPMNSSNTYSISIHEHERIVKELNKTITDISKQLLDSKSQLDSANKLAVQTQTQYDQLNKQFNISQESVASKQREIDALKKQVGDVNTQLTNVKNELEGLRNSPELKKVQEYKSRIEELQQQSNEFTSQKQDLERRIAATERQTNMYKPYMTKAADLQKEMVKQQDTYRAQISQFQTTVNTLQKSIETLKASHQKELSEQAARLSAVAMASMQKPPSTPSATAVVSSISTSPNVTLNVSPVVPEVKPVVQTPAPAPTPVPAPEVKPAVPAPAPTSVPAPEVKTETPVVPASAPAQSDNQRRRVPLRRRP